MTRTGDTRACGKHLVRWSWTSSFPRDVCTRSSRDAVLEDAAEFEPGHQDVYGLWRHVQQPVLLLRAARELLPGAGFVVSASDRDRFAREVRSARVVEIDANHYGIITAEATAAAIAGFFASTRQLLPAKSSVTGAVSS